MNETIFKSNLRKTVLSTALAAALFPVSNAMADTYVWGEVSGSLTDPATCAASANAAIIRFVLIGGTGNFNLNSDSAGKFDLGGAETPTCGSVTYDTVTQTGTAEIVSFSFFGGGPANARSVTLDLMNPPLDLGVGNVILANMLFDWNGTIGIPVSTVWDATGILNEMDGTPVSFTLDSTVDYSAGAAPLTAVDYSQGAAAATDGGRVFDSVTFVPFGSGTGSNPLATRTEDSTPVAVCAPPAACPLNTTPVADSSAAIILDTADPTIVDPSGALFPSGSGISGSPMLTAPFPGQNANFNFTNIKLISFTDTTAPNLSLNAHVTPAGTGTVTIVGGVNTYTEPGATCNDAAPLGNAITVAAPTGGPVDDSAAGIGSTTTLTYTCTDASGNQTTTDRTVNVVGPNAVITLNGVTPATQECGIAYVDAGASCTDDPDGPIAIGGNGTAPGTFNVDITGVSVATVGSGGNAVWNCTDSDSNNSIVNRAVNVVDTTAPVVTIPGGNTLAIESKDETGFTLPVVTVVDANGDCSPVASGATVAANGTVNFVVPDGVDTIQSTILYTADDNASPANSTTESLSVVVSRSEPVITLNGDATVVVPTGGIYTEAGMTIHDVQDNDVATVTTTGTDAGTGISYTIVSNVDTAVDGTYQVTYDAIDADGTPNSATQVIRTVVVGAFATNSNFTMLGATGDNAGGGANDVTYIWNGTAGNALETDTNFDMQIISVGPTRFFGFPWTAHHIRTFGPGTYTFDSDNATCDVAAIEATGCPAKGGPLDITMTVGVGQIGVHILFDYTANKNIDVLNVWDQNSTWNDPDGNKAVGEPGATIANDLYLLESDTPPDVNTTWLLVSTDFNGDGFNGSPMLEAPFPGFYANFNAGPQSLGEATPPCTEDNGCKIDDTSLGDDPIGTTGLWTLLASLIALFGLRKVHKD